MLNLAAMVSEVFASDGVMSRADPQFQPRDGQTQMAQAVAATIEQGGALVVEAGTGVGKTFAYLVPVLLSGERVVVSTATKALQDQLYGRDLPLLLRALALPNFILTPHVAWASDEAMQRLADQLIDNLEAFMRGESLRRVR